MNVEYAKSFLKDVKRLKDRKIAQRLEASLILLESAGDLYEVPGVKSMSGASGYYRIRIGQYRLGKGGQVINLAILPVNGCFT